MAYPWGMNLLLARRNEVHSREPGDRRNHHAGKELHGGDVLIGKGVRGRGKYLEYAQCLLKLA